MLMGWHLGDTGLSVAPCGLSSRQGGVCGVTHQGRGLFPPMQGTLRLHGML